MLRKLLFTYVFILFLGSYVYSAHIIGGEMTYRCLGNNEYEITMKVYRDCQGGGADFDSAGGGGTIGRISIYRGNSNNEFDRVRLDPPVVQFIQPDLSNPCLDPPPNVCVEEGIYTFVVDLPISAESYHLVYQRCCRNNTINNIQDPGATGTTYTIEITSTAQQFCNNSPSFDELPPIVICANENIAFNFAATDLDGDSLAYELCSPLEGGSQNDVAPNPDDPPPHNPVAFLSPTYTAGNPLGTNPAINIDPITGILDGVPEVLGQFVVGVCVKEYRNGVLLSVVRRDFQFNVGDCAPKITPELDALTIGAESYQIKSCGERVIDLSNISGPIADISSYYWNVPIGNNEVFTSSDRDVTITFLESGDFVGYMVINPGGQCADTAAISINISPMITATFDINYDSCATAPIQFEDNTIIDQGSIATHTWDFGDGEISTDDDPGHFFGDPGTYDVLMTILDTNGCVYNDFQTLSYYPLPAIVVMPDIDKGCIPLEVNFSNLSAPLDSSYVLQWTLGDSTIFDVYEPMFQFDSAGNYDITLRVSTPFGCSTLKTFNNLVNVSSPPDADFSYTPAVITKLEPDISFINESTPDNRYQWLVDSSFISIEEDPDYTFLDSGNHEVMLIVKDQFNCADTIVQIVRVVPLVNVFVPNVFSPNGDRINDEFRVYATCDIENFNLKVFDRWGSIVYNSNDYRESWDGFFNYEESVKSSVFVWLLEYKIDGETYRETGDVTVIR